MANGSFGLSGFPTAPTTTSGSSGGANNPAASVTATVQSADGFDAGELIYQRRNTFGTIPDNFIGSATFPLVNDVPVMGGNVMAQGTGAGSTIQNLNIYGENLRCMSTSAKLTNGNIVFVFKASTTSTATGWVTQQSAAHFKIVSESGATVVDTTAVSTTQFVQNQIVGVTALATGGFVVCFINTVSNYLSFAIYNNSGTVTTALTTDSSLGLNSANGFLDIQTRSDGSWIVLTINSSNVMVHKVYSSAGVQVYPWTTSWTAYDPSNFQYQVIVRSDNSWVLFGAVTGNTTLQYSVYSSTNTVVVAPTSFTVNAASTTNGGGYSASLLTDGRIVFTIGKAAGNSISNLYYRTLSTGNSLSAELILLSSTIGSIQCIKTFATSAGGLFVFVQRSDVNDAQGQGSYYYYFNSSLVNTFGGTQFLQSLSLMGGSLTTIPSFFETTNYIGAMCNYFVANGVAGTNMIYFRFDKTNLILSNFAQQSLTSGSSATLPVSGYSRSGSTPVGASFLSSSTSISTASISASSTFVVGPVVVDSTTVVDSDSTTFANGNFAIISRNSSGVVYFRVYSSAGVLITTVTVTNAASGSTLICTKIIQLENGKIVVIYPTVGSPAPVTIAVYSSAYALLGSTSFTPAGNSVQTNVTIAPIYGSRILVQHGNSSNEPAFRVFSDTPAQVTAETTIQGGFVTGWYRCSPMGQGFVVGWQRSGSNNYFATYFESAVNTWTQANATVLNSSAGGMWYNPKFNPQPNGLIWAPSAGNGTGENIANYYLQPALTSASTLTVAIGTTVGHNNATGVASCVTAFGTACWVNYQSATTLQFNTFGSVYKTSSATSNLTLTLSSLSTSGQYCLTPLRNTQVALSYVNSSGILSFVILEAGCSQYFSKITSGVSSSNPVALAQQTGATLLGVSTTAATAGGTGTVQINGPATLNANYSTTQSSAFDFQNPVTYGVKGVVNGLNVNLQGNV